MSDKCPKCGSACTEHEPPHQITAEWWKWGCGSKQRHTDFKQSPACRIRELEQRVLTLAEDCELYEAMKEGFSVRVADVESDRDHLRAEVDKLRAVLEDCCCVLDWYRCTSNSTADIAAKDAMRRIELYRTGNEQEAVK